MSKTLTQKRTIRIVDYSRILKRKVNHFLLSILGKKRLLLFLVALQLLCFQVNAQTAIPNYKTSWIANDGGKPDNHIMHSIDNMYVAPDGTAYCGTGWEEGGANVSIFKDGKLLAIPPQTGTGSWGRNSNSVITVDQQHLYHLMSQHGCDGGDHSLNQNGLRKYPDCKEGAQWQTVRRFTKDGNPAPFPKGYGFDGTMLIVNIGGKAPVGIAVSNTEIFIADPTGDSIKVYNKTSMEGMPIRKFKMDRVGLLSFDSEGFLWMLQNSTSSLPAKLIRFSITDGSLKPQEITFPSSLIPTSFCVDKSNRILVTDNGIDQNIKIYQDITVSPKLNSTFGNKGGIYSGRPGEVGPLKFNKPMGVGTDDLGNIYVANTSHIMGGASIESYKPTGEHIWKLLGLAFVSTADLDNETQVDAYDHDKHYKLDFSKTAAGEEWEYVGYTVNKFKYSDDLRLHDLPSPGFIKNIDGKKFLYTSNMYGHVLGVFRFNEATDGEIAIPALFFTSGSWNREDGWPKSYPTNKEFIWRDQNGDGGIQENEYDTHDVDNYYSLAWGVDDKGGIWKGVREQGLRYFPLQGIDANGVPIYSYGSSIKYPLPEGTNGVKRIWYDAAADELFLAGFSAARPDTGDTWWALGSTICKYSNWSKGNRSPNLTLYLPFAAKNNTDNNAKAFCVEGDYIFVMRAKEGKIAVYRRSDGSIFGMISPGPEVDFKSGWTDINIAITARKRKNGEYIIFAEEDGYGKIMMYRWCESGNCVESPLFATTDQNEENKEIVVYPNPNEGNFNIQLKNFEKTGYSILIYDYLGISIPFNEVVNNITPENINVNLSNRAKGIYCIEIISGQSKFIKKVLVK